MILVGCSGFPVPATRYLPEYSLVEVAETLLGPPGPAVVRRWRRESGASFVFTALAPREMTADAFKPSAAADAAWTAFVAVARDLSCAAVVFSTPPEIAPGKAARAAAHAMFERLVSEASRAAIGTMIWEPPPSWELRDAEAAVRDLPVVVARDPARHPPYPAKTELAYYRLPGPAGHRSRYEDPALDRAAATVRDGQGERTLVIFANVDMYADSKRLRKLLEV